MNYEDVLMLYYFVIADVRIFVICHIAFIGIYVFHGRGVMLSAGWCWVEAGE